ncbi:uncharacterized protein [Antedon mediterranea]|uniref:uncharacterized protein n=1 Tax=Antedon mediterranea TaxID=105859 RepID=UPI003AF48014
MGIPESVKIKSSRYRQLRQAACYDFGLEHQKIAPDLSGVGCMGIDIRPRRGGLNIKAKKSEKPVRFSPEGQYMLLKQYALGDCSVPAPTAKALKSEKIARRRKAAAAPEYIGSFVGSCNLEALESCPRVQTGSELNCFDLDSVSAPRAKAFSNSKRKIYTKSFSKEASCFDIIEAQSPPPLPPKLKLASMNNRSDTSCDDMGSLCGMDFKSMVNFSDLVERGGVLSGEKQLKRATIFKKKKGFSLGFPKRKTNVSAATAHFSLESCNSEAFENRCHFQTDMKSDDELDFDLLSYYQMENNELALTSAESDAIYHSVQRVSSAQHKHNKSWRIPCLRELLKLEKLIEEHAQIISQTHDEIETCKSILSTAVVVCLLEYLLVNLVKVCQNGTRIWTRTVYRTAFYSLWEGESYMDKKSKMSKKPDCVSMQLLRKLTLTGLTLTEYVEKHILGAWQHVPDLDIRSFNFAGSEVNLSAYILKLLWSEFDWESKRFWKLSATFAVIFAIKRRFVVALLERAGIKALDLTLQKKVHFMLAIAIALERFQSSKNLREIKKQPIKQLNAWLDESENDNYGLASHLELGQDWRDVASKLCTNK